MARLLELLKIVAVGSAGKRALLWLGIASRLYQKGHRWTSRLFFAKLERDYGLYIGKNTKLGRNINFPHPDGIVIGDGVVIEEDVVIYQQVTLGGARMGDAKEDLYPHIGSGTVIFAGAKIIGPVRIGKNCIVGANAVVNKDVPDNHVAVGVPARNRPKKEG